MDDGDGDGAKVLRLADHRPGAVNDSAVATLEWLLAQAKAGEIVNFAGAFVDRGLRGGVMIAGGDEALTLLGSVARMQVRLAQQVNEQADKFEP